MSYDKFHISLPRFSGRKTIALNGLVFAVASGWLTAAYSGLCGFGPFGEPGLHALAAVGLANGVLRVFSDGPVWWKRIYWAYDLAEGESETVSVYRSAAEFVERSDFTEYPAGKTNAGFLRDLDSNLSDYRKAFFETPELPLDADREQG